MEDDLYGYYGWDPLWGGGNYFGAYPYGMDSVHHGDAAVLEATRTGSGQEEGDPYLRSLAAVTGYHIQAKDGPIGHVENVLVDDADWGIRYLVIDTRNWWAGHHVQMAPYAVREISWLDRSIALGVTRAQVKGSPPWNPVGMIERSHQERPHSYYGWPGYGW